MNDCNAYMSEYQTSWRKDNVATPEWGRQNTKRYPWILPYELWEEGLWPGIRSDSTPSLPDYLRRERVQKHQGVHNLKSSWVLCANLYFPFRASRRVVWLARRCRSEIWLRDTEWLG